MHTVRILHISDLHSKAEYEPDAWARRRVLGDDAWMPNLDALLDEGPADILCFTGDLAYSGRTEEYTALTPFLEAVCARVKVPLERVFVVPGNHDINRTVETKAWRKLRSVQDHEYDGFSGWIAGGKAPRGFVKNIRDAVLQRQSAYRAWVRDTLGRPTLVPNTNSPHPRLGYRETIRLQDRPFPVHIIGLDSAWLAGDEFDNGKLMLTDKQVGRLTSAPNGNPLDGLRIALMHHPLEQLADVSQCRPLLAEGVDLLLRGHRHETEPSIRKDPSSELFELAAGCLYDSQRYPNACHMLTVTCDDRGRPTDLDLHLRTWSSKGHWYDDNSLGPKMQNGRLRWWSRPATSPVQGHSHAPAAPAALAPTPVTPAPTPAPVAPATPAAAALTPPVSDREMREALIRYFDTSPSIRMLLRDAGVDVARVPFDGPALIIWGAAIEEAKRADLLRPLFRIACQEYPSASDLRALASKLGV